TTSGRLTLDHVVPRSRGGDSVWENVVTSCAPCNMRKGNRLPDEIQMTLRKPPRAPAPVLFIHLATPKVPDGWQPYLTGLGDSPSSAAPARPDPRLGRRRTSQEPEPGGNDEARQDRTRGGCCGGSGRVRGGWEAGLRAGLRPSGPPRGRARD